MSYVNYMSNVDYMSYVNYMRYVGRLNNLYELCKLYDYFMNHLNSLEITQNHLNCLIFLVFKILIFLLIYKDEKLKLEKQKY